MKSLEEILTTVEETRTIFENMKKQTLYAKTLAKIEKLEEKKAKLEVQLESYRKKAHHYSKGYYEMCAKVVPPSKYELIAEELIARNPNLKSYKVMGPFGLNAETSLWFFETEEGYTNHYEVVNIVGTLTFHSDFTVWNGEETNQYAEGTLGDLNGENKVMIEVTSIEQLNELLHKTIRDRNY